MPPSAAARSRSPVGYRESREDARYRDDRDDREMQDRYADTAPERDDE